MRMSKMGIVPYPNTQDFVRSIPNKAIEYLSADLPILTSLRGTLQNLIEKHQCGVPYRNGDPGMLADKVTELYGSGARVTNMSRCAKRLFDQRFVAERVYGELARHLESVANRAPVPFSIRKAS